jgi:hypothetical protein
VCAVTCKLQKRDEADGCFILVSGFSILVRPDV